jgi:hypothetical protein
MMAKRLVSADLQSGSLLAAEQPHQASWAQKKSCNNFRQEHELICSFQRTPSEQSAISSKRGSRATRDAYSGKYLRAGR